MHECGAVTRPVCSRLPTHSHSKNSVTAVVASACPAGEAKFTRRRRVNPPEADKFDSGPEIVTLDWSASQ